MKQLAPRLGKARLSCAGSTFWGTGCLRGRAWVSSAVQGQPEALLSAGEEQSPLRFFLVQQVPHRVLPL